MKTRKVYSFVLIAFVLITFNAFSQEKKAGTKERYHLEARKGTVTAINKETREVTLMGPKGELVTIKAGDAVKRFDQIAVGDIITFEYWEHLIAEFREPTAEEIAEPYQVVDRGGRTPEGVDPGAVVGQLVKAVVTIEALNRPYMLATVKGPRGNYLTIEMEDKELITEAAYRPGSNSFLCRSHRGVIGKGTRCQKVILKYLQLVQV